jgi:DNA invertase Pin-like site-specific DNA recombinase
MNDDPIKEMADWRRRSIRSMIKEGRSYAQIAKVLKITRGRVWQIFHDYQKPSKTGQKLSTEGHLTSV